MLENFCLSVRQVWMSSFKMTNSEVFCKSNKGVIDLAKIELFSMEGVSSSPNITIGLALFLPGDGLK